MDFYKLDNLNNGNEIIIINLDDIAFIRRLPEDDEKNKFAVMIIFSSGAKEKIEFDEFGWKEFESVVLEKFRKRRE